MDARREKALVIAETMKIRRKGAGYLVPSQSGRGAYAVNPDTKRCTCPDFEERRQPCKHVLAVEIVVQLDLYTTADGTTTMTETRTTRVTYSQPWAAYNAAAVSEKETFCRLLHELCATVPNPPQTRGRPRLPLSDMLFAACFKVYSTVSGRRFMTDLRDAQERGLIARTPHYNSIFNVIESPEVTDVLHDLIERSSLPLRQVEHDFAVDSTGFGTSQYFRYYSMKYGREMVRSDWIKAHAIVGTKTNIVTGVEVHEKNRGDVAQLPVLVKETAKNFTVREVSADKAYVDTVNFNTVESVGGHAYIAFKSNNVPSKYSRAWNRMYHLFAMNRDEYLAHYHKRSNVEATFSAIKRVFGGTVRSRTKRAQINEVLLKVLAHNIRVLIHEMRALGITPRFDAGSA